MTDHQIQIAVNAATANGRTNYTAAARALGVTREWLVRRLKVPETRGSPMLPLTLADAVRLHREHGSYRLAAAASGSSATTIRARATDGKREKEHDARK